MRKTLMLMAASTLPLAAVAQPAAESATSAEVSELLVQARKATEVSGLVVEACRMPSDSEGYSTRSSRPVANKQFDAPLRPNKRTEESPGTREFILRNIANFREGKADFGHMDEGLAKLTRTSLPEERLWIKCRGTFKNIKFLHVSQDGYDDFEVDFAGAAIEWEVNPLNSRHVTDHWAARFYYPEPATRALDELLKSMEHGSPNYGRVAADFAPTLQAQWPRLQQSFRKWTGPHAIVFLRQEDDGSYAYKVTYKHHIVFWTVAPLDAAGKIKGLTNEEVA